MLDLKADTGTAAGVAFTGLTATAHVTPDGIGFDPLALDLFGGHLAGTLRVELGGEEPVLAVNGDLSGVDMAALTAFAGQPGSVTGTLRASLAVTGQGTDPEQALARVRGQGSATISDGTMKGLQLVRPIVLAFGKPDAAQPTSGGEQFSSLGATYTLAGGVVTLRDLSFASRDVELSGAGTLTLAGGGLDITADAKLSRELTAQAGRDLVRYTAENGQVTVPATVTGTVESPQVGINVGSVAKRAVTNEIKRQTESAIRSLFKKKKD
ncbi:MAG: AsmA-like C-terminal region-containing protein [Vicinamibacterales bacterium]